MRFHVVTRRLRGNILMVAILVAIVLFFLSVAMVTANRQNFIVSSHLDNRFQAEGAARAGANMAIQLMRTDPQWESKLSHAGGKIGTATFSMSAMPFTDPQGTNYFWQISGQGQSGQQISTQRVLAEQIKMVSNLPDNAEALLFAYTTGGQLAILDATFHWSILGTPPQSGATLAANNGPLFTFGGNPSAAPAILDWRTIQTPKGNVLQLMQVVRQTYNDTAHIVYLNLDPTAGTSWLDVPDPGPVLMHSADPTVNGQPVGPVVPNGATLVGGSLEWYDIVGQGLAASETTIYCHAMHSLYVGAVVRSALVTQPGYWRAPAVLSYDILKHKWTVVCDMLKVSDLHSTPGFQSGQFPDVRSLGLVNTTPYAYSQDLSAMLQATGSGWQPDGGVTGAPLGVYGYDNKVVTLDPTNATPPLNAVTFDGLSPAELNLSLAAVPGLVPAPSPTAASTSGGASSNGTPVLLPMTVRSARTMSYAMWGSDATAAPNASNPFQLPPGAFQIMLNAGQPYIAVQGASGQIQFTGSKIVLQTGNPILFPVTSATPSPNSTPTGGNGSSTATTSYGSNTVAVLGKEIWTVGRMTFTDAGGVPQDYNPASPSAQPTTSVVDALIHYDGSHWQAWPGDLYAFYIPSGVNTLTSIPFDTQNDAISPEHVAVAVYKATTGNDSRVIPLGVLK